MYGYVRESEYYELCRLMIDINHQGNGYGRQAINMVMQEMVSKYQCNQIHLCVDPNNIRVIKLYKSVGFRDTGDVIKGENLYILNNLLE